MNKGTVLVVDDEGKIRSLVKLYLIKNNYRVITAANGKEALAIATRENPDIIILDIMLPDMNGFEVCRSLRKIPGRAELPVVYLSSLQESESIITGLDAGGDDYITKPFDPNVLIARVNALLRRTTNYMDKEENESNTIVEEFTYQERKILQWVEMGYTNKEIAEKLKLKVGTVKVYNHQLFQKLQVKNRTQAIVRAKEIDLL
jgi:DNA-binding response OmpR family regulator